jgi:hypothetical protein
MCVKVLRSLCGGERLMPTKRKAERAAERLGRLNKQAKEA